MMEERKYII